MTQDIDEATWFAYLSELSWANTADRSARTRPAREAFERRFLEQADGDPVRAAHLRRAHFKLLGMKSLQARRARQRQDAAPKAATEGMPDSEDLAS